MKSFCSLTFFFVLPSYLSKALLSIWFRRLRSVVGDLSDMKALYFSWKSAYPFSSVSIVPTTSDKVSSKAVMLLLFIFLIKPDRLDFKVCRLLRPRDPASSILPSPSWPDEVYLIDRGSLTTYESFLLRTFVALWMALRELYNCLCISTSSISFLFATWLWGLSSGLPIYVAETDLVT